MKKSKKLIALFLCLAIIPVWSGIGECAWDKNKPHGSDLISDIDTLVIANNTALEESLSGITGDKNLYIVNGSAAAVTVTADCILLQGTNTIPMRVESVSETITITTDGVSGLDVGDGGDDEAAGTWYYIYIIAKADGTVNGLLSEDETTPTMPDDYVYKTRVGAVFNDSGEDFVDFKQWGKYVFYDQGQAISSGAVGAFPQTTSVDDWIPIDVARILFGSASGSVEWTISWNSTDTPNHGVPESGSGNDCGTTTSDGGGSQWRVLVDDSGNVYLGGTADFWAQGFILN